MTNGRYGGSQYWKFLSARFMTSKQAKRTALTASRKLPRSELPPDSSRGLLKARTLKSLGDILLTPFRCFSSVINRISDNIYVGYGHKYSLSSCSPLALPETACEYPPGPELYDGDDPTVEQEAEAALTGQANEDEGEDDNEDSDDQ